MSEQMKESMGETLEDTQAKLQDKKAEIND